MDRGRGVSPLHPTSGVRGGSPAENEFGAFCYRTLQTEEKSNVCIDNCFDAKLMDLQS